MLLSMRRTTVSGVPVRVNSAIQVRKSNSGYPSSASVGTSGSCWERLGAAMASAHFARANVRQDGRRRIEDALDLPTDRVGERGRAALVRDMRPTETRQLPRLPRIPQPDVPVLQPYGDAFYRILEAERVEHLRAVGTAMESRADFLQLGDFLEYGNLEALLQQCERRRESADAGAGHQYGGQMVAWTLHRWLDRHLSA